VLYSFEDNGDYVYDVEWSPINPALFAAVDGTGKLDLWNLNNDTEVKIKNMNCLFGNIAEKAVCRGVFLTIWHSIWHCILSAEFTKTHSFRLSDCFFCDFVHWELSSNV